MDKVVEDLQEFVAAYLDDLIIFGDNSDDHPENVRIILQRLREAVLTAKPTKCHFVMKYCVYTWVTWLVEEQFNRKRVRWRR